MAWIIRGTRGYQYRTVRRGGKVIRQYEACLAAEDAALFRQMEAARRLTQEAERADWEAERRRLDEAERQAIEVDAAYDGLATAALLATGHHRPQRGRWRRRRVMAQKIQAKAAATTLATGAQMADLLARIDRAEGELKKNLQNDALETIQLLVESARDGDEEAMPALRLVLARRPDYFGKLGIGDFAAKAMAMSSAGARDVFLREVHIKEIEAVRNQLAGPNPTALERLLCERVALSWFDANQRDIRAVEVDSGGCTLQMSEYLSRQRSRAQARFLAAVRSLATVRRLALPVLHVHSTGAAPAGPCAAGGRLSVLAHGPG